MTDQSLKRYEGQAVLVTGGGAGIGEAISVNLASEGALVGVLDRSREAAERVVKKIVDGGGRALVLTADVTEIAQLSKAIEILTREFGPLKCAVNNAGIGAPFRPLAEQSAETWEQVIGVNLTGVFNSMKAELPVMQECGGSIVNIASITAMVGVAGISPYVAAKHGVVGLTRSAALDYGKCGIRVNAVCPTFVKTALTMAELKDEEQWQALEQMHPLGRYAQPEDIASVVAFLGSSDAGMVTGGVFPVDGGFTAA